MRDEELISEPEEQGLRLTDCFHCGLLFVGGPKPCPRCGGEMRFVPARMMDSSSIRERVERAVAAYLPLREGARKEPDKGSPRFDRLVRFLEMLHIYRPESLQALEGIGKLTLEDLKKDYEELSPGG